MKTKLNNLLCSAAVVLATLGCAKDHDRPELQQNEASNGAGEFTLIATYGGNNTKVALDEDGLGLSWQPGDCLYLVDVAGKNSTVKMTTSITEPSKKAAFRSQSSVLSGEYVVISGDATTNITPSCQLAANSGTRNDIRLYGSLTITDGQKSAEIALKLMFPKLKFAFKNIPAGLKSTSFGMAVSKKGIPYKGKAKNNGFATDTTNFKRRLPLGESSSINNMSVVVPPYDYTGSTIIFYYYGTNSNGSHVTYEIQKQGINLEAGTNYNIEIDFSKAAQSTITGGLLNTALDFRAAAYWSSNSDYIVSADIDFNNEIYFPICCNSLEGNNHTLKNLTIDWEKCDYVGLLSSGYASNITLTNVTVKGRDYVGAISGSISGALSVSNCVVTGTVNVKGRDYVGAISGSISGASASSVSNCVVTGTVNVKGQNYVGAISGSLSASSVSNCVVTGTSSVQGKDTIGGLFGKIYETDEIMTYRMAACRYEGDVIGTGSVGGISSTLTLSSYYSRLVVDTCYVKGNIFGGNCSGGLFGEVQGKGNITACGYDGEITGKENVGGIVGQCSGTRTLYRSDTYSLSFEKCYAKGKVSGDRCCGGLLGANGSYLNIGHFLACWYEGDVVGKGYYIGGIAGFLCSDNDNSNVAEVNRCYTKGNISGENYCGGLIGKLSSDGECYNSYHIGDVTVTNGGEYTGGIAGNGARIYNCYSYGTVTTTIGISPDLSSEYYSKNLTSSPMLSTSSNSGCNRSASKTFLAALDVINGDEAYSTQVWEGIDAQCPLLQWQSDALDGTIDIPGYKDMDW